MPAAARCHRDPAQNASNDTGRTSSEPGMVQFSSNMGIHEPSDAGVFQEKVVVKAAKWIGLESEMMAKRKPGWPPAPMSLT